MSSTAATAHSWEAQKENAAPLERGRNVSSFGLRQSGIDKKELEEKLRNYEALVGPSEDQKVKKMENDPLAHWLSYIKFYQNSFPSDTRENFLIIERCVRALIKMKQYSNDDRFVSVCAKYADKTKDPGQVFKYIHQQKVGAHTALFWIAWAFVAEKDNDFPFAEQIFKKGISKNAEPLQMLKLRHQQFQRRMSRHWLNSSKTSDQLNDEYESGEQNRSSRSTLGGIPRDRLRRNDRSQRRVNHGSSENPLARRQNTARRPPGNNKNSSTINNRGSFNIFVEEEGENAYNLDQQFSENERATIARESDRRKENTIAAERWNERGGMQSSYPKTTASTSRSKGPMPAFSVFVDEECAAQNERQKKEQQNQMDRQRQVRDERTFKERDSEGMAEKLFRNPVRYLKDPNRLQSENVALLQRRDDHKTEKPKNERKSRAGFTKRLLKNENGEEQCFEEARARASTYTTMVDSSNNFNLLQNTVKTDQSSQMDLDDGGVIIDISMTESMSNTEGNRLFDHVDGSFGVGLNQTAISHASSTANEIDLVGVGLHGKQEEETINTKFAMRELSMMFSSPAFGVASDRRRLDHSHASKIDELGLYEAKPDISFGNVGDEVILDNAICNNGKVEICGEDEKNNGIAGFAIFQDENSCDANEAQGKNGFQIYDEGNEDAAERKTDEKASDNTQSGVGFQIFVEGNEDSIGQTSAGKPIDSMYSGAGFQIYDEEKDDDFPKRTEVNLESGDTASISDAIALFGGKIEPGDETSFSSSENNNNSAHEGEDTADISLINELFPEESRYKEHENILKTKRARVVDGGNERDPVR